MTVGRAIMLQGTTSDAGKSFLVTATCAWAARQGIRVAPFKAQNMSNNARVVDGGEIGTAQWLQALAAGVTPDVRMNPILLKPESDVRSQVVVNGRVDHELTESPWRGRSRRLWPHVVAAYRSLAADHDLIVIEGAGSPAETNLWDDDIVNMAVADLADAPVTLVADIDRGGAFAHLYGTWALLPPHWQARLGGFVLNKFRGDPALLDPAPRDLETRTGVPVVGVVPLVRHGLPDEEGPTLLPRASSGPAVRIVCGPYASNLDEFTALQQVADVRFVNASGLLDGADLVVVPGSKHTARDLAWLRDTGIADDIVAAARRGTPVMGICGGLQLLGRHLRDPHGVEGVGTGLGLLPLDTEYASDKATRHTTVTFGSLDPPWTWLSQRAVDGYEIRHGHSEAYGPIGPAASPEGIAYARGNVLGVYAHGVFESPGVLSAFAGAAPPSLGTTFDALADLVEEHFDARWRAHVLG